MTEYWAFRVSRAPEAASVQESTGVRRVAGAPPLSRQVRDDLERRLARRGVHPRLAETEEWRSDSAASTACSIR